MPDKKPCKLCDKKRFANTSWCYSHYRAREKAKREEKALKKKIRIEGTIKYKKKMMDKAMRKADKLFQEWGRQTYNKCCICGGEYNCLHHFVFKSQSLHLRYDDKNGAPVCLKCHCKIHTQHDPTLSWKMEEFMKLIYGNIWKVYMKQNRYIIQSKELKYYEDIIIELTERLNI